MNNLIKTFVTALILCVTTITFAQSNTYVRSFTSVQFLNENLDLTDEQTKRVKAFIDEQDKQLKAVRSREVVGDQLIKAVNDIRSNTNNAIKSVLNEEQLETFDQLMSQRKNRRDFRTGNDNFTGLGNIVKKLNLTETQTTAYNSIMKSQAEQVKVIREDMPTSENRAELRIKILEVRKATQEKIKKILTEDQLALYKELLSKGTKRYQNRAQKITPNE